MKPNPNHLVWLDLEMTGLNTAQDAIIEIATIITDNRLNIIAEGPELAIYQPESVLAGMDKWNIKQHTKSGLIERVKSSTIDEEAAEAQTLEFIMQYVPPQKSPICGNSICQDRRFLARLMPKLEHYFHYRNLDVSTVKVLAKHWAPALFKAYKKDSKGNHRAMFDVKESIAELRYYQERFFHLPESEAPAP